ncbi:MAG: acetate--CoA ligase family protein [Acidimicrobiales bacterium]
MTTLSELESKKRLAAHGVAFPTEHNVGTAAEAGEAADSIGYPVVAKLNGESIAHKTERGLVRLGLRNPHDVTTAAAELFGAARAEDGQVSVLIAPMLSTIREFIAGVTVDEQFGPCVLFGVGGVLAEAIDEAQIRLAPLNEVTAAEMIDAFGLPALLGEFRGEPAVDRDALTELLVALGNAAVERDVLSIDLNPVLIDQGRPVAVDALVELRDHPGTPFSTAPHSAVDLSPLFDPRGVIVAGASSHPGKFGFVALHNIVANGFAGAVGATNRDAAEILGVATVPTVDDLPAGESYDLVVLCTPAGANPDILRACARRGVKAAFITSAGYAEADEAGERLQRELIDVATELGIVIAGPNGQGIVSTPSSLCAQIVAPYPPAGRIGIASQSGNLVSSFMNLANASGVGVSRAVSAGNAAMLGVIDYLDYYADDPHTSVALAYVEGLADGRSFADRLSQITSKLAVVVVKGGATDGGAQAAASHTGSLASNDRVFDGALRSAGAIRAVDPEQAFDFAATFATQPLPKGNRIAIMTAAGGWGVVAADAVARSGLELLELPDDLKAAIDDHLPPRWSKSNPIDLAGGETRDTIPTLLHLVAGHEAVDALLYLGMGIQANQAAAFRRGGFYPDHGLERIVEYHERQDARFATAAAEASEASGKPVLVATELGLSNPDNPGPAAVRASGRLCYASAGRAIAALDALWRYAARQ